MYQLSKNFRMSGEDLAYLEQLPDNLPEVHLTPKQKDTINRMYHKYIGRTLDMRVVSQELFVQEQRENWPGGGQRVKKHEAQRMVLGWLAADNRYHARMTDSQAAEYFFRSLHCRPTYLQLLQYAYEKKGGRS